MTKYWVMKTFQEWWGNFQNHQVIGIDEEGVDRDYLSMAPADIQSLISNKQVKFGEYQNRVFEEFCKWMQIDDLVIIGTGQTTDFNISGIVRVSGKYRFNQSIVPRHIRDVEILKIFDAPVSMRRFMRTPRLERIDEADFHQSIISLL